MDYPKFIVSNQMEESIRIQRVKDIHMSRYPAIGTSWHVRQSKTQIGVGQRMFSVWSEPLSSFRLVVAEIGVILWHFLVILLTFWCTVYEQRVRSTWPI